MTYQRPGVYITERLLPAPIASAGGVNAAGAIIGAFAQGSTDVTRVTSWYQFTKLYGSYSATYKATFGVAQFFLNGGTELYVRRVLGTGADFAEATTLTGAIFTVTAKAAGMEGTKLSVKFTATNTAHYYDLTVSKDDGVNTYVLETYPNVVVNNADSPDFVEGVVNPLSNLVSFSVATVGDPSTSVIPLTGTGLDGALPIATEYSGVIDDFSAISRPLVIFAPEITAMLSESDAADVQSALIDWADAHNGFAVLDVPAGKSVADALTYAGGLTTSSNAAVYYPHLYIQDPLSRNSAAVKKIGNAGSVAGVYLANDAKTGPFKAPAGINARVARAVALEKSFTSDELDSLNSSLTPINPIRNLPGAGIVIMGARTLLQDGTANKYVNMRRSLIYIRKQLEDLTQFVVFENNNSALWARIRTALGIFLNDYYNQGGLRGSRGQAYYIKVDAENNTADTIALGQVNIEVGVALQYPAEYVVITLSQQTNV